MMARPDSVTYTKTGMLFGSGIVAESSDIQTQNPELAQMLPDYVENCVIGDTRCAVPTQQPGEKRRTKSITGSRMRRRVRAECTVNAGDRVSSCV
ncbi:hypothetical protein ABIE05_003929 [Kosakonia cowanii]